MIRQRKYIRAGGRTIELQQWFEGGRFYDNHGTEYALRDGHSIDQVDRCGIGWLSVPAWFKWTKRLNEACGPHEFKYVSKTYQAYHTREEADNDLARDIYLMADGAWWSILRYPARLLSRLFGSSLWENDKTK